MATKDTAPRRRVIERRLPRRSRPTPDQRQFTQDLTGLGLIALSLLLVASLALGPRGYFPRAIVPAIRFAFGLGAYLIPALTAALGLVFLLAKHPVPLRRAVIATPALFLLFLAFSHLQIPHGLEFHRDLISLGGGIFGALVSWLTRTLVGELGSYLLLALATLTTLMVLTGTTARDIGSALAQGIHRVVRWLTRRPTLGSAKRRRRRADDGAASEAGPARQHTLELDVEASSPEADADLSPPISEEADGARAGSKRKASSRKAAPKKRESAAEWRFPGLDLLDKPAKEEQRDYRHEATENIMLVEDTLESFGISAKVVHYERGPAVTRYEVEPVRGIRVSRVANLADDLACALAALDVRVEAPVPGKSTIGIEVPNSHVAIVSLREILESDQMSKHPSTLAFAAGKDVAGDIVIGDLSRMPHLLVAGATNAGKSVCLNSLITSLVYRTRPDELRFIMVDPKRVELSIYDGIPHLIAPVVQTAAQAADVLRKAIGVMEQRFDMFAVRGVRNIAEYNEVVRQDEASEEEPIPYIIIVIDELADLMMQAKAEFEHSICRLAQLARATGIHLVIATQRPSVDVITGLIKANISSRISLAVASQHDSRTILDHAGAERLIGRGDMLYAPIDATKPRRVQGAFISGPEIERVVDFLREQGEPEFEIIPEVIEGEGGKFGDDAAPSDTLYSAAVQYVVGSGEASVSMLQRRFKVGYARAGRLIDMMERRGVVGPSEGSKPRKVLLVPSQLTDDGAMQLALETRVTDNEPIEALEDSLHD